MDDGKIKKLKWSLEVSHNGYDESKVKLSEENIDAIVNKIDEIIDHINKQDDEDESNS